MGGLNCDVKADKPHKTLQYTERGPLQSEWQAEGAKEFSWSFRIFAPRGTGAGGGGLKVTEQQPVPYTTCDRLFTDLSDPRTCSSQHFPTFLTPAPYSCTRMSCAEGIH